MPATAMNIAFLAKRYDTVGGVERNLFELTRRLARRGHRVTLYCPDVRRAPEPGVALVRIPRRWPGRLGGLWAVARRGADMAAAGGHEVVISFARALRQDIVRNGGGTHRHYLRALAPTESRVKGWLRTLDPYHRATLAIERQQYSPGHYRKIVANAPIVKQDIMESYGVPDTDIQVILNGVDTGVFHAGVVTHRAAVRERHRLPQDATVALFVGNGFKRKGLDHLLEAAAPLAVRGLHLLVVGGDPQAGAYAQRAAALGLGDHIRFAGPQTAVHEYYGAADLFTLPSLYEPFGHSTVEALACGLPVVGVRRTGASDLLSPRLAEFTLDDPSDRAAFTARLERLMDPAVREALREDASAIGRALTLDANADAFERLCREVIALKEGRSG